MARSEGQFAAMRLCTEDAGETERRLIPCHWTVELALGFTSPEPSGDTAAPDNWMFAFLTPQVSRGVMLSGTGAVFFFTVGGILTVEAAVDPDWRALECVRAHDWEQGETTRAKLSGLKSFEVIPEVCPQ